MSSCVGYVIEKGRVALGERVLLDDLELCFPDHAVTAVMGPGGVGKTTLLRLLGGHADDFLRLDGSFTLRGAPRDAWPREQLACHAQQRASIAVDALRRLVAGAPSVLLLDEPSARSDAERAELTAILTAQRARGLAIVVTHDLSLARALSDYVCLLCAGRVEAFDATARFFDAPPTPLAARFVRQGNCWPRRALPSHFRWLRPGLAGMGRPGLLGDVDADLSALSSEGIDTLVSLTERRFPQERLKAYGIAGRHLPIADMGVPSIHAAASLCRDITRMREDGAQVVLHCEAGLGRTGTLLASYLVWQGARAEEAVDEVRSVIRGALQSPSQELFVQRFSAAFGGAS
jgi:atypical dual specificity phosphatase